MITTAKSIRKALALALLFITSVSCENYLQWEYPSLGTLLSTPVVTNPTATSVQMTSTVELNSNLNIGQTGIAYHTQRNPTWDNFAAYGDGTSEISVTLDNLTPNTQYYARSFAFINGQVYYSSERSFKTDAVSYVKTGANQCASLNGITSSFRAPNGTTAPWGIGSNGYEGDYWAAPDPSGSASSNTGVSWVSLERALSKPGIVRFWIQTHNPGYNNRAPEIFVDGSSIGFAQQIAGELSSWYWMQVETPLIDAGTHTIRFEFNSGSTYVDVGVDELEFLEIP
jgi:hypothetical protein